MDSLVELLFKSPFRPFQIRWQSVRREQLCGCGSRRAGEVRTDCLKRRTQNIRRLYIGPRLRLEPAVRPRRSKGDRPVRLAAGRNKLTPKPADEDSSQQWVRCGEESTAEPWLGQLNAKPFASRCG